LVLVENGQGDVFGHDFRRLRLRHLDRDILSGTDRVGPPRRRAGDADGSFLDQLLDPRPGEVRTDRREVHVQARPGGRLSDPEGAKHSILDSRFWILDWSADYELSESKIGNPRSKSTQASARLLRER